MDGSLICSWPDCLKTAPFKTIKLLETHLENIHVNPLVCTQPHCSYARPFPKKGDLDRHLASKHQIGRLFRCPRRDCKRHERPFGRKDKLQEHVRSKRHGRLDCQFDHCKDQVQSRFLTKEDLASHVQKDHGMYECAVGSCEGSKSAFLLDDLKWHVRYCHAWSYRDKVWDMSEVTITTITTAGLSEILQISPDRVYERCMDCMERKKKTSA